MDVMVALRQLLANETIIGFNLGDELVCGGVKSAVLHQYANTVRAAFPRESNGKPIIWYNECASMVRVHTPSKYTIPEAIDCEWRPYTPTASSYAALKSRQDTREMAGRALHRI